MKIVVYRYKKITQLVFEKIQMGLNRISLFNSLKS
jgi:hypothetical protein